MAKHWRPEGKKRGWAGQWDRHRWPAPRRGGVSGRDIAVMACIGVAIGLAASWVSVPDFGAPAAADADESWRRAPVPDRWAESRRSQALLHGQEGSPGPDPRRAGSARAAAGSAAFGGARATPALVRIVDGDTFWYGGVKIRVADIDTPEVHGRCAYETQLAARATARMSALLAQGPFELMPIDRDVDRYGRKLRVVTRGGRSLGDQLVAEGLARTWTGRREPWCT